ncbi:hypothetical protein ACJX0J_020626 [Zea mays]
MDWMKTISPFYWDNNIWKRDAICTPHQDKLLSIKEIRVILLDITFLDIGKYSNTFIIEGIARLTTPGGEGIDHLYHTNRNRHDQICFKEINKLRIIATRLPESSLSVTLCCPVKRFLIAQASTTVFLKRSERDYYLIESEKVGLSPDKVVRARMVIQ